jgi:hypothetical protein
MMQIRVMRSAGVMVDHHLFPAAAFVKTGLALLATKSIGASYIAC